MYLSIYVSIYVSIHLHLSTNPSIHLFFTHIILSYLISSHLISSYLILSYLILSYLILSYLSKRESDASPGKAKLKSTGNGPAQIWWIVLLSKSPNFGVACCTGIFYDLRNSLATAIKKCKKTMLVMWLQRRDVPSVFHSACHTRCAFSGVMWVKSTP